MTSTARLPEAELTGLTAALIKAMSRRMLGDVPAGLGVMWNNPTVLKDMGMLGRKVQKWKQVDPNLKTLAQMAAASTIGCTWCLDYAYFEAHNDGLDVAKAREVPRWRVSTAFTPLERRVLAYAEAMCQTSPSVTDAMVAELREDLGAAAVVELTAWIAFANLSSRSNVALGIAAQGLAESCGLQPLAQPERPEVEQV